MHAASILTATIKGSSTLDLHVNTMLNARYQMPFLGMADIDFFVIVLFSVPKIRMFQPGCLLCHLEKANLICLLKSLGIVWPLDIRNL